MFWIILYVNIYMMSREMFTRHHVMLCAIYCHSIGHRKKNNNKKQRGFLQFDWT